MKLGFIGAGKCGMSLARYFKSNGIEVTGFCSRHEISDSGFNLLTEKELAESSDIIFVTVTDTAIGEVWKALRCIDLTGKVICHCSGSMTSEVFEGAAEGVAASMHPMLAFNSCNTDKAAIKNAFFTMEGGTLAVEQLSRLLSICGNRYRVIKKECKAEYHAAACFASNFVVAVCERAEQHLMNCGFSRDESHSALVPLMKNNMDNIVSCGTHEAITGPASRGDMITIEKHLSVIGDDTELYQLLTDVIINMKKN